MYDCMYGWSFWERRMQAESSWEHMQICPQVHTKHTYETDWLWCLGSCLVPGESFGAWGVVWYLGSHLVPGKLFDAWGVVCMYEPLIVACYRKHCIT